MTRRSGLAAALMVALGLTGCGGGESAATGSPGAASPLDDCASLVTAPGDSPAEDALPDLTLPCFTGAQPVALADLRGPAVVNLWASWCGPCREELPELQRYADRAAGQVHVLGVVTQDERPSAAAFAEDAGVTFPALDDRDGQLLAELGVAGLPVTLLVDAAGRVAHVHQAPALTEPELASLVAEHLGVTDE